MICGTGLDLLQSSGEFSWAVCRTGVGSNSIFCKGCKHWVHKKCSGFKRLTEDPDYRCTRGQGTARPLDGRPQREIQVGSDKLLESVGLRGPRWLGSSWQRGIAESGSSHLSTLMIETPGDLVWDLPCVLQASYLEGGPLLWILPLYLHVNKKSDDDDGDIIDSL